MKFAVLGDPVSHSLSPRMHAAAYEAMGLDLTYEAIRVPLEDFTSEIERLRDEGYVGANVTIPLKEAAFRWSAPDTFAAKAQAVNTLSLSDRTGINTDGPGFVDVVRHVAGKEPGARILVLGAGGSARALVFALMEAKYRVTVCNRTHARALELAAVSWCEAEEAPNIPDFDVVVNATSSSMSGVLPHAVLADAPSINRNRSVAIDLYYSEGGTVFTKHFADCQWRVLDGRHLLVAQGARSFEHWLGISAPLEAMRSAVGL